MEERIKKQIAKEWLIFILCFTAGFVWYGLAWASLLITKTEEPYVRLWSIPIVSGGAYLITLLVRSIIWSFKTLKRRP